MSVNEALLLIGHGSARFPDAARAMRGHADALRGSFDEVEVAVLNGAPSVADALGRIDAPVVRVVPFFMEDGYFSRVAVPRAVVLAEADRSGDGAALPRTILCPPVGVHDALAGVIERVALAACADLGVPSHVAAVVVVGHGSASEPGRALALHRHTSRVASTTLFARVEAACLEEAPLVADVLASLRTHPVVAVGFFANEGGHVREDLPGLVATEIRARPNGPVVRVGGSVIEDPAIAAVILDQARGAP